MDEKKLLHSLIALSLGALVLLSVFFLGGHVIKGGRPDDEMKAYFGKETEFVDSYEDTYIYRAYSRRDPEESFEFQVKKKDPWDNNFVNQMMKTDTLDFWKASDREPYFINQEGEKYLLEQGSKASQLKEPLYLSVACSGWDDLSVCAGEIEEWLCFALEDTRYFWNYSVASISHSSFGQLEVRIEEVSIWIDLSDIWYNSIPDSRFREALTELMEQDYAETFPNDPMVQKIEENILPGETLQELGASWSERYLGGFDSEYMLENEGIYYRLVVADEVLEKKIYFFIKSCDQGETWELVNTNPFGRTLDSYAAIECFEDEKHGTILGSYLDPESGQYQEITCVTEDGGETFTMEKEEPLEETYSWDPEDYVEECILEDGAVRYRLIVWDYIMGDYLYGLIKSIDGGKTWTLVNRAPFGENEMYGDAEMTFEDENHGSISGIYSDLDLNQYKKNVYTTEDGGETFVLTEKGQHVTR